MILHFKKCGTGLPLLLNRQFGNEVDLPFRSFELVSVNTHLQTERQVERIGKERGGVITRACSLGQMTCQHFSALLCGRHTYRKVHQTSIFSLLLLYLPLRVTELWHYLYRETAQKLLQRRTSIPG